jgi:hypothetical protein
MTPDMDDFGHMDCASVALDPGVAVIGSLRCHEAGDVDSAIDALRAPRAQGEVRLTENGSLRKARGWRRRRDVTEGALEWSISCLLGQLVEVAWTGRLLTLEAGQ